jgi:hypothetical protein
MVSDPYSAFFDSQVDADFQSRKPPTKMDVVKAAVVAIITGAVAKEADEEATRDVR